MLALLMAPSVAFQRQLHDEGGAPAGLARHDQAAAMALDDVVADVETEPGAAGLGGVKRFEDGLQLVGPDAAALIADARRHHRIGHSRAMEGGAFGSRRRTD